MNPILSGQPVPQLGSIKPEHIMPALNTVLAETRHKVAGLKSDTSLPTFINTYVALEFALAPLDDVTRIANTLESVLRSPDMVAAVEKMNKVVNTFMSEEIYQDIALGARFQQVAAPSDRQDHYLYTVTRQAFEAGGAFLAADDQKALLEIDNRLISLYTAFADNIQKGLVAQAVHVIDPAELQGLSPDISEALKTEATKHGLEGWLFIPERLLVDRTLAIASNPGFRRRILTALESIGNQPGHDNRPVIQEIHALRQQRAVMLGYANYAEYSLTRTMAGSFERANTFVNMVLDKAMDKFERTVSDVSAFAMINGNNGPLEPSDLSYWAARYRAEHYACDVSDFEPYLAYDSVIKGSFEIVSRLLDVTFSPNPNHPIYHPDVTTYDVLDHRTGKPAGVLYVDPYMRDQKVPGAWMNHLQTAAATRPSIVTLNLNLLKPQPGKPCLISLVELETHFHELGHAMHGLLGHQGVRYPSLQGTAAPSDFTELHSMLLENWGRETEALALFARHHETGAPIPTPMLAALKSSSNFMAEATMLRLAANARRDFVVHATPTEAYTTDVGLQEKADLAHPSLPLLRPYALHRFSHLFEGGSYAAGYYAYLWSEMLQADAFQHFADNGLFNPATSHRLGNLYRAGSSRDPNQLYREFNGTDAAPSAMLVKAGVALQT